MRARWIAIWAATQLVLAGALPAQRRPGGGVVPMAETLLQVTPNAASITLDPQVTDTVNFTVKNLNYTGEELVTFTCGRSGAVLTCNSLTASARMLKGATRTVKVVVTTGTSGTGTITLTASVPEGSAIGSYVATVQAGSPVIDVSMNPGTHVVRSACVMADAGPGAAFQCGELIATHAMPAFRSLDRQRSLTLFYASGTAAPHVAVMANYTLQTAAPDSLIAELSVYDATGTSVHASAQGAFSTAGFQVNGPARRLALGVNFSLPTGVYKYKFVVMRMSASPARDSVYGEAIVVNRTESRFGAGWSLIGTSELYAVRNDGRLLVEGDGSAAVYEKSGSVWVAPAGAYRDTLFYSYESNGVPAGYYYWRRDLDGTRTFYDANLRQVFVVDQAQRKTEYIYAGSDLASIRIGPYDEDVRYHIDYADLQLNGAPGRRVIFTDPSLRLMVVNIDPSNDAIEILDPGVTVLGTNATTRFAYGAHRILQRTSRVGLQTVFRYFQTSSLVGLANVLAQPQAAGLLWWYEPIQLRGYPGSNPDVGWGSGGGTVQLQQAPIAAGGGAGGREKSSGARGISIMNLPQGLQRTLHLDSATLWIDGPHNNVDASHFWVNAHGAPTRIQNPYSHETSITYDATHTLLPVRVRTAAGAVTRARYDARARLTWSEDSTHSAGRDSVTYVYNSTNAPHLPTAISSPGANPGTRVLQTSAYNSLGLPDSIRDAAGNVTRLTYNARAQLATVTQVGVKIELTRTPTNLVEELIYETDELPASRDSVGRKTYNLRATKTPSGLLTAYDYDVYGNLRRVTLPSGDSTVAVYNARNALTQTRQYDGATPFITTDEVSADGLLMKRTDPRGVVRQFGYDGLGREIYMLDEFNVPARKYYDNGLGVTRIVNRHTDTVKVEYDLMGRLYRRTVPAIYYTNLDSDYVYGVPGGIGSHLGDLLAMGDVIEFQYDADGHMTSADNRYATVTRTYNKEGSLATEQQVHKWNSASLQLQYTYNRAGLRQTMSGSGRSYTYGYNGANQLSSIAMSTGGSFGFLHDEAGRLMTVNYPSGHAVEHYYKLDGQPLRVSAPVHTLTYQLYDNAGRLRELHISGDSTRTDYFEYDGRGQLTHLYNSFSNQAYRYDASGNRTHAFECGDGCGNYTAYTLEPLTNRIANWKRYASNTLQHEGNYYFNINGEQTRATTSDGGATDPYYRKFSHYNAAGQMVGDFNTSGRSWDRFGSDGLGRRVKGSWADPNASTFYDGDGVIKFTANLETAEYVQGPGIDAPLIEYFAGLTPCYYATTGNRLIAYFQASGFKCPSERWQSHGQVGGAVANSYGFGLSGNSDAGVSYFRNRLYDSNTGRFTSEDPIGFAGGINLYGYTGNNPVSYTDPFGLCPWCIFGRVVGGAVAGLAEGYAITKLLGADYTKTDFILDAGLGAIGGAAAAGLRRGARLPEAASQLSHIFSSRTGHLIDTPANRKLLLDVANDRKAVLGTDKFGNVWHARTLDDGSQVWVSTRNRVIQNGGLNEVPRTFNPSTGLSGGN